MNHFGGRARSSDHEFQRNPEGPFVTDLANYACLFGSFPHLGYILTEIFVHGAGGQAFGLIFVIHPHRYK